MNIKEIRITRNQQSYRIIDIAQARLKIIYWFFSFPNSEISLNELAQKIGIAKAGASLIVGQLEKEGFLKKQVLGKIWRITCNTSHPYNSIMKIPFNLSLVYQSGVLNKIREFYPGARAVILFGSDRKGDDNEKSDIDIAVEIIGDKQPEIKRFGTIEELGYRKKVVVNLYVFSREKTDLNLFSNIANGIVLSGFLEARP